MTRTGRRFTWNDRSATRADRFDERIAAKVANASTNVPEAVANDAIVAQSIERQQFFARHGGRLRQPSPALHAAGPDDL